LHIAAHAWTRAPSERRLRRGKTEQDDAGGRKRGREQFGPAFGRRQTQSTAHELGAAVREDRGTERKQRKQRDEPAEWREERHQ
jgi:hypothetical protein